MTSCNIRIDYKDFPDALKLSTSSDVQIDINDLVDSALHLGDAIGVATGQARKIEEDWRRATLLMSLDPNLLEDAWIKSKRYERLDPSEKVSLSYFQGMSLAASVAKSVFGCSQVQHFDHVMGVGVANGIIQVAPRNASRPDLVGYNPRKAGVLPRSRMLIEAKGRSNSFDSRALVSSLNQLGKNNSSLAFINPATNGLSQYLIASQSYFSDGKRHWQIRVQDPEVIRSSLTVLSDQDFMDLVDAAAIGNLFSRLDLLSTDLIERNSKVLENAGAEGDFSVSRIEFFERGRTEDSANLGPAVLGVEIPEQLLEIYLSSRNSGHWSSSGVIRGPAYSHVVEACRTYRAANFFNFGKMIVSQVSSLEYSKLRIDDGLDVDYPFSQFETELPAEQAKSEVSNNFSPYASSVFGEKAVERILSGLGPAALDRANKILEVLAHSAIFARLALEGLPGVPEKKGEPFISGDEVEKFSRMKNGRPVSIEEWLGEISSLNVWRALVDNSQSGYPFDRTRESLLVVTRSI